MEGTKHRTPWAFKAFMALVLASTLAFPYAAFAFGEPNEEMQTEEAGQQPASDPGANGSDLGVSVSAKNGEDTESADGVESAESETLGGVDGFEGDAPEGATPEETDILQAGVTLPSGENASLGAQSAVTNDSIEALDAQLSATNETELRQALLQALTSSEPVTIKVANDIQLTQQLLLMLPENQQVTIEADTTKTITSAAGYRHLYVSNLGSSSSEGSLLFKNIVFDGNGNSGGISFLDSDAVTHVNAIPGESDDPSRGYGLTITNCAAHEGGAVNIVSEVQVELHFLQLENNHVSGRGGAIFSDSGASLGLYQSTVSNCSADAAGGGVYAVEPGGDWEANVFFGKCQFKDNAAPNGGAAYVEGDINATASTFEGNKAAQSGGALYVLSGDNAVVGFNECGTDSTPTEFVGNQAGENGGALYARVTASDGTMTVSNNHTHFSDNIADTGNGGAMAVYGDLVDVWVVDCGDECGTPTMFINNAAAMNGGAIYAEGGQMSSVSAGPARFYSNTAGIDGGGICAFGDSALVQTDEGCSAGGKSTFQSNFAQGNGGGIRIVSTAATSSDSYVEFYGRYGVFTDNEADGDGGGISMAGNGSVNAMLSGIDFEGNASTQGNGGAIAAEGNSLWIEAEPSGDMCGSCGNEFSEMNFSSNSAAKNGGAIYAKGLGSDSYAAMVFNGTYVMGNKALAGDGGGLYAEADNTQIEFCGYEADPTPIRSTITDNQASGDGGGMRVVDNGYSYVTVSDAVIHSNASLGEGGAAGNGGAACLTGEEISFSMSAYIEEDTTTLASNTAAHDGGAIYMDAVGEASIDLTNTTVNTNSAQGNGGAVFMQGDGGSLRMFGERDDADPSITIGLLSDNRAVEGSGGAAYVGSGIDQVWLSSITIFGNEAALDGGALYVDSQHNGPSPEPTVMSVDDVVAEANAAGGDGGAFYLADGDASADYGNSFDASRSRFMSNEARGGNGGAVYLGAHAEYLDLTGYLPDEPVIFTGNASASNGGGVYVAEGLRRAQLEEAEMSSNEAALNGGAIYLEGMKDASDADHLFEVNASTFNGNVAGVNGGAIWLPYEHLSHLTVDDTSSPNETSFSNNTASRETESHLLKNDDDIAMHGEKVFTNLFSVNPYAESAGGSGAPFNYAYSNYDVSYRDVYVVTYDGNGATGGTVPVDRTSYASGDTATVLGQGTLVRDGYTFKGWALSSDSTTPVGTTVRIENADVMLYAIWQADDPDPEDPAGPTDPKDPADPQEPAGPKDPSNPSADGSKGGVKARGLATTGDPVSFATALGALALAAAAAGLLTRRRVRDN